MGKSMHLHKVHVGEIWTAWFPFTGTEGGYSKKRPVLVKGFDEEGKVIVQRISTKHKYGSSLILYPELNRPSYLLNEYASIEPFKFRHMIFKPKNGKGIQLGEKTEYPNWWEKRQ